MNKRLIWIVELFLWIITFALLSFLLVFAFSVKDQKRYSYYMFFKDIDGLTQGSPVRLMGMQIGYVQDIKIFDNNVFVSFLVTNEKIKIPEPAIATVEFYGLGGSKSLEIMPVTNMDPNEQKLITIKEPYRIQRFYDVQNGLARTIVSMGNSVSNLLKENEIHQHQERLKMSGKFKEINKYLENININKEEEDKIETFEGGNNASSIR